MTLAYHEPAMADLDDVDRALIDALVADGRASYAALARRIGMSQAAIKARVLRLLDSGGIHILGRIDPRALGYGEFAYCLIDVEGPVEPAADRLAEMDEAAFVLILAGARGLFVEFRARDAQQLDTAIERARSEPGVRGVDALSLVAYVKQDWSQSGQDPAVTDHRLGARRRPVDATDIKLLESLAANGRATFAEMADAAGMSQAATRERTLALMAAGVVTVQTIVSPGVLGVKGYAGLMIEVDGAAEPVATKVAAMTDITLVARVLGRFDVIAEASYRDEAHLAELLDRVRSTDGVRQVESFVYLVEVKESMTAGLS
ncbi:MAG: Lrp/AsnC family transcriptional regulator [Acidimicrobiaceae bacterium]|nr:Lrp/AsnC family transcriptional regulator [Acidimicrobiaceae bacterium]